jgi:hypothetical protein
MQLQRLALCQSQCWYEWWPSSFFTTAEDSEVDSDKVDDGKAVLVFVAPEACPVTASATVCALARY